MSPAMFGRRRILRSTAEEGVEVLDVVEQGVGATGVAAGEDCVAAEEQRVEDLVGLRTQRQPSGDEGPPTQHASRFSTAPPPAGRRRRRGRSAARPRRRRRVCSRTSLVCTRVAVAATSGGIDHAVGGRAGVVDSCFQRFLVPTRRECGSWSLAGSRVPVSRTGSSGTSSCKVLGRSR